MSTLLQQAYICSVFWSVAEREQSHLLVMAKRERLEVSGYCVHRERGALAGGSFVCICLLRASAFPLCHRASWLLRVDPCCSRDGPVGLCTVNPSRPRFTVVKVSKMRGKEECSCIYLLMLGQSFQQLWLWAGFFFLIKSTQRQASNPRGLLWELWSSEPF